MSFGFDYVCDTPLRICEICGHVCIEGVDAVEDEGNYYHEECWEAEDDCEDN